MILKNQSNQNNQNLISNVNQLATEINRTGKNPKQMVMEMIQNGKVSQSDLENAKRFAESKLSLFK